MREIVRTGILGGVAFAALALGAERDADACTQQTSQCGIKISANGRRAFVGRTATTVATAASPTTACSTCTGDLSPGVVEEKTEIFTATGTPTTSFDCGSGPDAPTATAYAAAASTFNWSSTGTIFALPPAGVTPGVTSLIVTMFDISSPEFTGDVSGVIGNGELQGVGSPNPAINPAHFGITSFNSTTCPVCPPGSALAICTALDAAAMHLEGDAVPTLATKTACARSAAAELLGLEMVSESEEGGCSTSRGGAASGVLLGLVGIALGIRRRRRRA